MIGEIDIETDCEVERPRSARERDCTSRYLKARRSPGCRAAEQEDGRGRGQSEFELRIEGLESSVSSRYFGGGLGKLLWSWRALFCSQS